MPAVAEVWLEARRLPRFSDVLPELDDDPSPRAVLEYLHALVREIVRLEDRGWIRERLVDLLFYERRRWCWEMPLAWPSGDPRKTRTLPPVAEELPHWQKLRSGTRRVQCPRCPTVITAGPGTRLPERCDFCGAALLAGGLRALVGGRG